MSGNGASRFIDTNILVYAHDMDSGEKHDRARLLIRELWESGGGFLSIQVLQEFFVAITRNIPNPLDIDEATEAVADYARWAVHVPVPQDILDAIVFQRRFGISFWDAMIINSASKLGCPIVYSADLNSGQHYGGVRVVNPFASER